MWNNIINNPKYIPHIQTKNLPTRSCAISWAHAIVFGCFLGATVCCGLSGVALLCFCAFVTGCICCCTVLFCLCVRFGAKAGISGRGLGLAGALCANNSGESSKVFCAGSFLVLLVSSTLSADASSFALMLPSLPFSPFSWGQLRVLCAHTILQVTRLP